MSDRHDGRQSKRRTPHRCCLVARQPHRARHAIGLAGIGGLLWAMRYGKVEPWMGMLPGLKAFIAAVLGGVGSIPGAVAGGLLLGVLESVTIALLPEGYSGYRDAVAFVVLIVILLVRPSGLFGRFEGEKV